MSHNQCICADCERDRSDAKRYRWLRDGKTQMGELWTVIHDDYGPPHSEFKCGTALDVAIDAACSSTQNGPEQG